MELDELKNAWTALDNKLKMNETLNEHIVKEMLRSKTNKALNCLNRYELLGTILCFIALPFLIFMYGRMVHTLWGDIMFYFVVGMLLSGCITQPYKLWLLSKIDLNKIVCENIESINRYSLFIKREKIAFYIYMPVLFALIILAFISLGKIELWRWVGVISVLVFAIVMSIWQYRKVYDANIQAIKKSLEELKELEEE